MNWHKNWLNNKNGFIMRRLIIPILALVLFSCSKKDDGNFIFEETWTGGLAEDVILSPDTMYVIAGYTNGFPFVIKIDRSGKRILEYHSEAEGEFNSIVIDTSGYYAAGNSDGEMIVSRIGFDGIEDWTVSLGMGANILRSVIRKYDEDSFIVTGSDHVDSLDAGVFKIAVINRNGDIESETEVDPGYNIAVSDFVVEPGGNIYVALAKSVAGSKSKASVAEITLGGNIIWETELYNNNKFAAACINIERNGSDDIYVTGKTELRVDDNNLENSFLSILGPEGNVIEKIYLENSNCGVDIAFDDFERVHLLNRNCFLIDIIGTDGSTDESLFRTFEVCDPYETDTYASGMKINADDNYILCGAHTGKVYYALRKGFAANGEPAE